LDWEKIRPALDERGFAVITGVMSPEQCREIADYYGEDARFRSRIDMARHGFGRGEYKYFAYPLPAIVERYRAALYPNLVPLANEWSERFGEARRFPAELSDFLDACHRAGQNRPTPLLLSYGSGDYNCLHQDIYGSMVFPFQATFFLSRPGIDYTGGEFVLTEQRPRRQSRAEALLPNQGDTVIFAGHHRPVRGSRGTYRANLRHGVSTVHSGTRVTLGIIFHDAR
jgi:hypothetical protein